MGIQLVMLSALFSSGAEHYYGPLTEADARERVEAFERDYGYDSTGVESVEILPYPCQ